MIILYVIIGLSVLILVHELGHFFIAKLFGVKVNEFGIGYPPRIFAKKYGETEYSINALPFGGFVKIHGENETTIKESDYDYKRSFVYQKPWKRSAIILAGVFMNLILGWFLLSIVFMVGSPQHLGIVSVLDNSPAKEAGIESSDIVLKIEVDGDMISDPIQVDKFINIINNHKGKKIDITLQRGDDILEKQVLVRENPPEGEGGIGIALMSIGIEKEGFFSSIWSSFKTTGTILKKVIIGFYTIISGLFTNPAILKNIAGPVGIFVITKQAGSMGLIYLIQFIALISINLVVLNLLPFPALDGGRFLFIMIEKIKGSPVPEKFQTWINVVGFILLIILMIVITIKDVKDFIF